jgi:hypothetical protein
MISLEEFRSGAYSLPASDLDEAFSLCFSCPYLSYKEFSVGDGLYYYFCSYYWPDRISRSINQTAPPCLTQQG